MNQNILNTINFLLTNKDLIMLIIAITVTIASVLNKIIPNQINKYLPDGFVKNFIMFGLKLIDIMSIANISRNQENRYKSYIFELEELIKELQSNPNADNDDDKLDIDVRK